MQYFRQIMKEKKCSLVTAITESINSKIVVFSFIPYKLQWRMEHEAPFWTEEMTENNLLEPLKMDWYQLSRNRDAYRAQCDLERAQNPSPEPKKRKLCGFCEISDSEQGV